MLELVVIVVDAWSKKNDPTKAKLVFDHCHETLQHRGWLCDNCNRAMGMLGDDIAGMILSAKYIAKTMVLVKIKYCNNLTTCGTVEQPAHTRLISAPSLCHYTPHEKHTSPTPRRFYPFG